MGWRIHRWTAAGVALAVGAALATAGCGSSTPSSSTTSGASPVWLCRPGAGGDPCAYSLAATAVLAGGSHHHVAMPSSAAASKFDCFYVYPTVSQRRAANTGLEVTRIEIGVAVDQAAPFSRVCNVWAPVYRQQTSRSVGEGLAGDGSILRSTFAVAYRSVLSSWKSFLAHDDDGKPVILIGDSQGSAILIHLISTEIDHEPSVLHRLLVAILVGGNLQVPEGRTVGATFTHVPLCSSATETQCAIAFSSYPSRPPADSVFGRPGQGVSLQSGQTARQGQQVACVNPAALGGGRAELDPYFLTVTQTGLSPSVPTPWVAYPGLYAASCDQGGGATWLQVDAGPGGKRPVVKETAAEPGGAAAWGYHGDEFGLTLGDLLADVGGEEAAYEAAH